MSSGKAQSNLSSPLSNRISGAKRGQYFWLIYLALCLAIFLSAMELTAVSNALPVIVNDLTGSQFSWVGTAYALASTAFLPMSGGVAEVRVLLRILFVETWCLPIQIFGRRFAIFIALAFFIIGSALCGSARSMNWLIAARAVQGVGGGGILSISSIIVSDLVPLSERGLYNGLIGLTWALASAIGPLVGGALAQHGQWRWLFYLNLPIAGAALVAVCLFLKLPTPPGRTIDKLRRMDWLGNFIIISSTTSVVIGLTWGGVQFSWSSSRVLVPLILGLLGMCIFFLYEFWYAKDPIVPYTLLSNRTSCSGYIQTFITPIPVLAVSYYLPVYYQACKEASAFRSGVLLLGLGVAIGPAVVLAGISVKITQKYRPQLFLGWALFMVGVGTLTTTRVNSSIAVAVATSAIAGAGAGILYAVTYFPVLAPLPVTSSAHALAFFAFCRSFAGVWGVAIGATILQNELQKHLPPSFLNSIPTGNVELAYSIIVTIKDIPQPMRTQIQIAFATAVSVIWKALVGVLAIGLVASAMMEGLALQSQTDEKWEMRDKPEVLSQINTTA
ncbi:major facilitator superfamily domain-containing protein [Rhodocollybia butyracea]|uniref:Major facilitator superfamily domain-containing protein n=1 Tax=Rhodocollybia butyracea TaxID=206335 RepID=A0A9P5PH69_9AGAR|nr:major facilitator superfamily domain-containing protein [Rhodocollybia butyracea]